MMRSRVSSLLLLCAASLWSAPTWAAGDAAIKHQLDARAEAAIDKLVGNAVVDKVYDEMIPRILDALMPILIQNNIGREEEVRGILREELLAVMMQLKPDMKAKTRDIYLKRFTAEELEEMVRLSETPLGKKMNKEMPQIQAELFTWGQSVGQAAVAGAMPRIIDRMRAVSLNTPKGT